MADLAYTLTSRKGTGNTAIFHGLPGLWDLIERLSQICDDDKLSLGYLS